MQRGYVGFPFPTGSNATSSTTTTTTTTITGQLSSSCTTNNLLVTNGDGLLSPVVNADLAVAYPSLLPYPSSSTSYNGAVNTFTLTMQNDGLINPGILIDSNKEYFYTLEVLDTSGSIRVNVRKMPNPSAPAATAGASSGNVISFPSGSTRTAKMVMLSNGNIAICAWANITPWCSYAVVSYNTETTAWTTIKTQTTPVSANPANNGNISICALANGGFALAYVGSGSANRITTFDSVGVQVATTTTGTVQNTVDTFSICELSNGNLAVNVASTNVGTKFTVLSSTLTVVSALASSTAFTNYSSNATVQLVPSPQGGFAGFLSAGSGISMATFNNLGVLQGAGYPYNVSDPNYSNSTRLLFNDGVNYWAVAKASDYIGKYVYIKLTPSGVFSVTYTSGAGYNIWFGVMDSQKNIIIVDSAKNMITFSTKSLTELNVSSATSNISPSSIGNVYKSGGMIALTDGAVGLYVVSNLNDTPSTYFYKAVKSTVSGIATSSGIEDSFINVDIGSGAKVINKLKGSTSVTFGLSNIGICKITGKTALVLPHPTSTPIN
jgi:hypothetical protein